MFAKSRRVPIMSLVVCVQTARHFFGACTDIKNVSHTVVSTSKIFNSLNLYNHIREDVRICIY